VRGRYRTARCTDIESNCINLVLQPLRLGEVFCLDRGCFGEFELRDSRREYGSIEERTCHLHLRRPRTKSSRRAHSARRFLQTRGRVVPCFATLGAIRCRALGETQCKFTSMAVRGERSDQHDPNQRKNAGGEPGDAFYAAQTHSGPRSCGRGCDGHGRQVKCPHVEDALVGVRHGDDCHGGDGIVAYHL